MSLHRSMLCLTLLLLLGSAATSPAAPLAREILGSELLVKEYLDKLDVPSGRIRLVEDEPLSRDFPDYLFYVAAYPPESAAQLPAPLKAVNLFAVDPTGRVILLNDPDAIIGLFKIAFRPAQDIARCKEAVRATLLLFKARYPDYQFTLLEDEIKISNDSDRGKLGVGKLVAAESAGFIEVSLALTQGCDPVKLVETIKLQPVARRLVLPTTREIVAAERVVKEYLVTLHLSADPVRYIDDPVLVAAFPGRLFFLGPQVDPKTIGLKEQLQVREVLVVAPGGKPQTLFGPGSQPIAWFNSLFGPATSDPRLKEGIQLWSRLYQISHPTLQFGPPGDPEISTDEAGNRIIFSKTTAIGPSGRKWLFTVRLMFGKRGRLVAWWWGLRPV